MPLCEGLPEGPCPLKVNDKTVKIGKGDLLLCISCDTERRRLFDESKALLNQIDAVKQLPLKPTRSGCSRVGSTSSLSGSQNQGQLPKVSLHTTSDVTGASAAPSNFGDKATPVVTLIK